MWERVGLKKIVLTIPPPPAIIEAQERKTDMRQKQGYYLCFKRKMIKVY